MAKEVKGECHRYFNGTFFNPWTNDVKSAHESCSSGFFSRAFNFASPAKDPMYPKALSAATLDSIHGVVLFKPKELKMPNNDGINLIWLGHSCVLIQFDGVTILTDPSLTEKCGSAGPRRVRTIPCKVEELNFIDVVVLTADKAEFLSKSTVQSLLKYNGPRIKWFCGLGVAKVLEDWGCLDVEELDWWDSSTFKDLNITFTPAQNWSGRDGSVNKTLWGSWVIKGPTKSFFHVGATGYCEVFKTIGNLLGPFSVATLPIAGYENLDSPQWCSVTPEQALQIHKDIKSEKSLAIHWGTWVLSREAFFEPKRELDNVLMRCGLPPTTFSTTRIGRVIKIRDGEVDLVNSIYETPQVSRHTSLYGSTDSYTRRYRHSLVESVHSQK